MDPQSSLASVALALLWLDMRQPAEAAGILRLRRGQNVKDYRVDWYLAEALNQQGAEPGTATRRSSPTSTANRTRTRPSNAVSLLIRLRKPQAPWPSKWRRVVVPGRAAMPRTDL